MNGGRWKPLSHVVHLVSESRNIFGRVNFESFSIRWPTFIRGNLHDTYLCLHNLPFLIAHSKKSQGCLSILPSLRIISLRVNFEWFLISWWPTGAKFEEAKTGAPRSNLAFTVFQLFPLLLKKLHYRSKLYGKLFAVQERFLNYLDNVLWPYSALESWLTVCPFFLSAS